MKKILLSIAALLLMFSTAAAAEMKIGIIDLQRALNESEAGKTAKTELEKLVNTNQERINGKIAEKEKLQAEYEKKAIVLSEDARRKMEDDLTKLEKEIDRQIADANAEVQKKQRDMEISILNQIKEHIDKIAVDGKFTFILPSDVIIYNSEGTDITEDVIKKLNTPKTGGSSKSGN